MISGSNSSIFKAGIERKLRQTFHFPRLQAEGGFTVVRGGLLFRSVGYTLYKQMFIVHENTSTYVVKQSLGTFIISSGFEKDRGP